jgi:hypothetical protein
MENLIRKHFYKIGDYMIICFHSNKRITTHPYFSFSIFLEKTYVTYIFYKIKCSSKLSLECLIIILLFILYDFKTVIHFTNDIVCFSICEIILFNILHKRSMENFLYSDNCYKNITFYDYETISDNLKTPDFNFS